MSDKQLFWYFIGGAPTRMWALYDETEEYKAGTWDSNLLGFIERKNDGSWDCFNPRFCGNEPSADYAKQRVYNQENNQEFKPDETT